MCECHYGPVLPRFSYVPAPPISAEDIAGAITRELRGAVISASWPAAIGELAGRDRRADPQERQARRDAVG